MFGPTECVCPPEDIIVMTVDEYETLRLIDYEGMTQEQCSNVMKVARTTVQHIYNDARRKLSVSLVEGRVIKIEGGDYMLYSERERIDNPGTCRRHRHGRRGNRY